MSTPSSAVRMKGGGTKPVRDTFSPNLASPAPSFASTSPANFADQVPLPFDEAGSPNYTTAKFETSCDEDLLPLDSTATKTAPITTKAASTTALPPPTTITTTTSSTLQIDAGLRLYEPKRNLFATDEKFLYLRAALAPPMKQVSVRPNVLYKAEMARVEEIAHEAVLREAGVEEFARTGKARGLVQKTKMELGVRKLEGRAFTAVVRVWEGGGYVPGSLLGDEEDELVGGLEGMGVNEGWNGNEVPASVGSVNGVVPESLRKGAVGIGGSVMWERMYHPTEVADKLKRKYRWTRVDLFAYDPAVYSGTAESGPLQAKFDELTAAEDVDNGQFQLYVATVKILTSEGSLRDFIEQARDGASTVDAMHSRDAVYALLKKDHEKDGCTAVHGNKFFSADKDFSTTMQGLRYIEGTTRTLRLNAKGEPVVFEGFCQGLFLPNTTVAEFAKQLFGLPACGAARDYQARMARALQGRLVSFNTSVGKETRTVFRISNDTPATASGDTLHSTWRNKCHDYKLTHPGLPMLDVGTKHAHALIPAELCTIIPMQSFTGEMSPSLLAALGERRKQLGVPQEVTTGKTRLEEKMFVAKFDKPALPIDVQNLQLRSAFGARPTMLFVHAGVEQVKGESWRQFTVHFRNSPIFKNCGMTVAETAALFLEYRADRCDTKLWASQLSNFVRQYRVEKQPVAVIVSVQDDKHCKSIYQLVKSVCDVEIGAQSFIVHLRRLEQTVRKFGVMEGSQKAANEVIHRMRERNPEQVPAGLFNLDGRKMDIAIALNISSVGVDESKVAGDGSVSKQHTMYLAVFSSRDVATSKLYKTKVVLLGPNEVKRYDPSEHMREFVEELLPLHRRHRVTILRSGFMPVIESIMGDLAGKSRRASSHVHVDLFDSQQFQQDDRSAEGGSMVDRRASFADGKPVTASKGELANNEYLVLKRAIDEATGTSNNISYVLLQEDNDFAFTKAAKAKIIKKVAKQCDEATTVETSFFIVDTGSLNADANTVSAHRKVTVQNDATLISMTLIGDSMADGDDGGDDCDSDDSQAMGRETLGNQSTDIPSSISAIPHRPTPQHKSKSRRGQAAKGNRATGLIEPQSGSPANPVLIDARKPPLASIVATTPNPRQPPSAAADIAAAPKSSIRNSELAKLAMLWRDENLELFDTKWPIPTHLAHLAAKRAVFRLRADRFDKDDDTAPFSLPDVQPDVAGTLYYL
ncbi:hypothetical protein LTR08_005034 [Meristemomyces frigidus]|nr:hypothetical protein LTR08_005034 [Meristemomyces frigidus]